MRKIRGTQPNNPNGIHVDIDTVYVRADAVFIEGEDFTGWEYSEIQYKKNEFIAEVASKGEQLELNSTIMNMEVFGALSSISSSNEVSQAQMMMEIMTMLGQLQGGE